MVQDDEISLNFEDNDDEEEDEEEEETNIVKKKKDKEKKYNKYADIDPSRIKKTCWGKVIIQPEPIRKVDL